MVRYARYLIPVIFLLTPLHAGAAEKLRLNVPLYVDDKGGSLKTPEGIACDESGGIVVADTGNGRLLRYGWEETTVKGGKEIRPSQMVYPLRVQLDSKGAMLVLDGKLRRILRVNPDGAGVGFIDPQGIPAPAGVVPRSFRVDSSGAIYVLDALGERVLVLDATGKYQRHLPFPKGEGFFSDVAVSAGGDIFLLDSVNAAIQVARKGSDSFAPLGKSLHEYVEFPVYLAVDPRGAMYVSDQNGGSVISLGPEGGFAGRLTGPGWKEGLLYYPSQICISPKGTLAVADRNNNRVQVFDIVR